MINSRACVILCNFNDKEFKTIKVYAGMMGIRDLIRVSYKNGNSIVKDILDDNIIESDVENPVKDRAIIFNSLEDRKVSIFIDNMRKMRTAPAMKAIVTETSIEWTLNKLLENLKEERRLEKQGKILDHNE